MLTNRQITASALVIDILLAAVELKKTRRTKYLQEMEERKRIEMELAAEAARLASEMSPSDNEDTDDDDEENIIEEDEEAESYE